jgi:hypothetical protein
VLEEWPESWTQMERLKFVSPDRRTLLKFEGMGPIGADVRERAFVLAEAGFSPTVSDAGGGFLCYTLVNGRRLGPQDVSDSLLDHMARYCAFRVETFSRAVEGKFELATMLAFNIRQEFGRELEIDDSELLPRAPVLCDGRMHPHEWVLDSAGELIKVDAIDHGDNHFFPGPCDIAWDIAGVATEWQLCAEGITALLEKLRRLSQIDVSSELPLYMLAYSVFSLGRCKMALSGPLEEGEKCRLHRAYDRYRCQAERLLAQVAPVSERLYVA